MILLIYSLFIPVIRKIQHHMTIRSTLQKSQTSLWRRFKITLSCSALLGLTWVFAYLAIGDARELFQWLFCITNSLQGLFIFIFYVLLNKGLIKDWKNIIMPNSSSRATSNASDQSRTMLPLTFPRSSSKKYEMNTGRSSTTTGSNSSAQLLACKNKDQRLDSLLE
jgi:7 transmembrane receptor (Secretin family).